MMVAANNNQAGTALTQRDEPDARIVSPGRIRISAFAGRYADDKHLDFDQRAQVYEAAERAERRGADLLMLPGYSFGRAPINRQRVQELANRTGLAILAEEWLTNKMVSTWFYYRPNQPPHPLKKQLFMSGADKHNTLENNWDVINALEHEGGARRIDMRGVRIGVLLCGENTIVRNPHDRSTGLRFPELAWPGSYDVLLNPAHSTMKRWRELKKTFAFLSAGGRTLIHATNRGHPNDKRRHKAWGSTLAVYRDGVRIAFGDPLDDVQGVSSDASERDEWHMVTVDVTTDSATKAG